MTAPGDGDVLTAIEANYPGWRVWRTGRGLAARKAGVPPAGPHARGDTPAELMRDIERAGRAMTLTPAEQAALGVLNASGARCGCGRCRTRRRSRWPRPAKHSRAARPRPG